jgi:hypothetical protein
VQDFHEGDLGKVQAKAAGLPGYLSVVTNVGTTRADLDFAFTSDSAAAAEETLRAYCRLAKIRT